MINGEVSADTDFVNVDDGYYRLTELSIQQFDNLVTRFNHLSPQH